MRLIVDIANVQFQVTSNPKEKTDQAGKQKFNVDGQPMWTTQVLAQDGENGEVLQVSVAGGKPTVAVGQQVGIPLVASGPLAGPGPDAHLDHPDTVCAWPAHARCDGSGLRHIPFSL